MSIFVFDPDGCPYQAITRFELQSRGLLNERVILQQLESLRMPSSMRQFNIAATKIVVGSHSAVIHSGSLG
jgi:hypothetical protein